MDFETLRREVIIAIAVDDFLWERLVLKGGNALRIVYGIGARASLDIDYSMEGDFTDLEIVRERLEAALAKHLGKVLGLRVFDLTLSPKPKQPHEDPTWGGYRVEFKMIDREKFESLGGKLETLRRQAEVVAPGQIKRFSIDISKHEYCGAKETRRVGNYDVVVYQLAAIAVEKLRAVCQQMPAYEITPKRTARARDFYDIHAIVTTGRIDLASPENLILIRHVFAAKKVSLELLANVHAEREFHRTDWPSVKDSVGGDAVSEFDFYFDFVLTEIGRLAASGLFKSDERG